MKKYSELGTVHRGEPCEEYPGVWFVFADGKEMDQHSTFEEAFERAKGLSEEARLGVRVSVNWSCSENDPRIGEIWFTGFYRHGYFDHFGRYIT